MSRTANPALGAARGPRSRSCTPFRSSESTGRHISLGAFRAGGHHIGIHITAMGGEEVAATPFFLGANPAIVRHGTRDLGMRTLPEEEDLGAGRCSGVCLRSARPEGNRQPDGAPTS